MKELPVFWEDDDADDLYVADGGLLGDLMGPRPIGELMRLLRRRAGHTQDDLATLMSTGRSTITRIESGQVTNPRRETLEAFRRAMDASGIPVSRARLRAAVRAASREDVRSDPRWAHFETWLAELPADLQQAVLYILSSIQYVIDAIDK